MLLFEMQIVPDALFNYSIQVMIFLEFNDGVSDPPGDLDDIL